MHEAFCVSVVGEKWSRTPMDITLYAGRMKKPTCLVMAVEVHAALESSVSFLDVYTHHLSFSSDVTFLLC